jgi:ABC-type uncharacterized transport system involved in gliding motility auxiliary subunit
MATPTKLTGSLYALTVVLGVVAIAILINVISQGAFGRLDLTENNLNTLSQASIDAVIDLDEVEVTAYISGDLPETIRDPSGRERVMRLVVQKFRDRLEEYRSYSNGNMTLRFEMEDVVERAKAAKLQAFAGDEATATDGQLKFKEYALGATFSYKNVMEVLPLAMHPEHLEFELTKIFTRLKEKAANSILMKDVLRAGEAVDLAVETCNTSVVAAKPTQNAPSNPFGLLSKEASQARVAAFVNALPTIDGDCAEVAAAIEGAKALDGQHENLDRVLILANAFQETLTAFKQGLGSADEQQQGQAASASQQLTALGDEVGREYDDLVDAPGRKSVGFVCVGQTFCPFPASTPLIPAELQPVIGQKNPFAQQIVGQLQKMEERMSMILANVEQNLFRRRGFHIERVDLDKPVPTAVSSLVVFGPKASFSDWQLYQMDQFVMRGGSLVVFTNPWDVSLQNLSPQGEMTVSGLKQNTSNIGELLAHWGIKPTGALVAEPQSNEKVTVLALIRQGQLTWQTQRKFPYPLLPVLNTFDDTSPLVRSVASLSLPYTTHLELSPPEGVEVTALVSTSPAAVTVTDPAFPVEPNAQTGRLATMEGSGPLVVAATSTGTFSSYFKGKEAPSDPSPEPAKDGDAETPQHSADTRRDAGEGRILVIGSNLGLEPLGRDTIFEGFDLTMLTEQNFEIMDTARQWVANLQNWEVRLGQVQHTLSDNLQFLFNVLDWSIQQEGLVEIRSKQYARRPLKQLDESEQGVIKAVGIGLVPLLFILFGIGRTFMRRARSRRLKV